MRAAQVKGVAAVHVVVQGLLNQILRFVAGQLRYPAESISLELSAGVFPIPCRVSDLDALPPPFHRTQAVASPVNWAGMIKGKLSLPEQGRHHSRGSSFRPRPRTWSPGR